MNAPLDIHDLIDCDQERKKEEIASVQLLFSRWLVSTNDYMSKEGTIYKYTGTHWQAQNPVDVERIAFQWLSRHARQKATEKVATSCVASALLHMCRMPDTQKNSNIISVVCKNGTVQVEREGVSMHSHKKEDYITYCLDCNFDEKATSTKWDEFLAEAVPDADMREYLREYVGYTLMPDTRHQVALWLVGEGGTGKGTFARVASALHDQSSVAALKIEAGMLSGFYLAPLVGASLVVVDEIPSRIDEQSIKTLISGDLTAADRKYRDAVSFRPTAKWLLCGNSMPSFSDQTQGIWRRIIIAPFDSRPSKITKLLPEAIIANELSGVLNWALEGLGRLLGRGHFPPLPDVMNVRKNRAKLESDSVTAFVDDVEPTETTNGGMNKSLIYCTYANWCMSNGMKAVSSIKFWQRIQSIYPRTQEFRRGGVRCFGLLLS